MIYRGQSCEKGRKRRMQMHKVATQDVILWKFKLTNSNQLDVKLIFFMASFVQCEKRYANFDCKIH